MRWTFTDPVTSATYTFDINPNRMSSPHASSQTEVGWTDSISGRVFSKRAQRPPKEWTFSGFIKTEAQDAVLKSWSEVGNPVYITDHYNRTWKVVIVQYAPVERQFRITGGKGYTYDVRAYVLGRVS